MIIAGLTGGIASGKSTVAKFLCDAGARIIDADKIARQVVERGCPAYDEILAFFGETIVQDDGQIDRKRLGGIIFNDSQKKACLDAIVHPRVFEQISLILADFNVKEPDGVVILDIPLLLETGMQADMGEVIVVFTPGHLQLERLKSRDGIDEKAAVARIRSQMPIEEKRKLATIVIDNSGNLSDTHKQTLAIYKSLKQRAIKAPG